MSVLALVLGEHGTVGACIVAALLLAVRGGRFRHVAAVLLQVLAHPRVIAHARTALFILLFLGKCVRSPITKALGLLAASLALAHVALVNGTTILVVGFGKFSLELGVNVLQVCLHLVDRDGAAIDGLVAENEAIFLPGLVPTELASRGGVTVVAQSLVDKRRSQIGIRVLDRVELALASRCFLG